MTVANSVYSIDFTKELVEEKISAFLKNKNLKAKYIDDDFEILIRTMNDHVEVGGKRLRPFLAMLAYASYGGKDINNALSLAASWEMLHVAMLVHDDIIDRDDIRHGEPNISSKYRSVYATMGDRDQDHYSSMTALLAGDIYISMAQQLIIESSMDAKDKIAMLEIINEAIFTVVGGELMDIQSVTKPIQDSNARKIARFKTSDYSVESPLKSGALLAGADEVELDKLIKFGRRIGAAYQSIDDILGVFGDNRETGKSTEGDIRERKRTILIEETIKRLNPSDRNTLLAIYESSDEMNDDDVVTVRNLIIKSEARHIIELEISQLASEARDVVYTLDIDNDAKNVYLNLIEMLVGRKS